MAANKLVRRQLEVDTTPTDGSTNPVESNGVYDALATKQATLVSGTNIKTINGSSVLGSGNLSVGGISESLAIAYAVALG